jgi:NADH-quinone oxidoreductase subunit C
MADTPGTAELGEALKRVDSKLQQQFGSKFEDRSTFRGELTYTVSPEDWIAVLTFCRDSEDLRFNRLECLLGNHFPERADKPFEVVAHLTSLPNNTRLRVKVRLTEGAGLPTATDLWPSAGFDERECWEMFGITFEGHPNLIRLLTIPEFRGFPLRKDFPLAGHIGGRIRMDLRGKI